MTESDQHQSIVEDNAYFKRMLDMIPPQFYFSQDTKQQVFSQMEQTVEDMDEEGDVKKKKKKKKNKEQERKPVNIFRNQLVSKIQEDLFTKETENFTGLKNHNSESDRQEFMPAMPIASGSTDIDDKRARLRAKIEELQAKRKLSTSNMQRKKLRQQENRLKQKQKKKDMKQQGRVDQNKGGNTSKGDKPAVNKTPTKPIYNKDGQIVYSKFDFTDSAKKEKKKNDFKGKDYKRLLDKIEKRNEKINKLKTKDEKAAQNLQEKFNWNAVLQKAQGEKVKDNPEILKKSLKRKEKTKEKKKKKWENRADTVQKQKDTKQDKRNKHIKERKQAKKEKKVNKMKKKGRIVPGF